MPLCTTAQIKTHLGISSSIYDTVFAQLITQVDVLVEGETGVKTGAAAVTVTGEVLNGDGSRKIRTNFWPIISITALQYRDGNGSWVDYADEAVGSVEFDKDLIYPKYVVAGEGYRNIKVSYTCGYPTASVPTDLNLVAILLCAELFNQRNSVGFTSQNVLNLQLSLSNEDQKTVRKILTKYKRIFAF